MSVFQSVCPQFPRSFYNNLVEMSIRISMEENSSISAAMQDRRLKFLKKIIFANEHPVNKLLIYLVSQSYYKKT